MYVTSIDLSGVHMQNEENPYIIPSVSSACNSHHTKIIFIMLLPLSNPSGFAIINIIFLFFHSLICEYFLSFNVNYIPRDSREPKLIYLSSLQ